MPDLITGIIGGVSSIASSVIGAKASSSASKQMADATTAAAETQAAATKEAVALQRESRDIGLEISKPYREAGSWALDEILKYTKDYQRLNVKTPSELEDMFKYEREDAERVGLRSLTKAGMIGSGQGGRYLSDIASRVRASQSARGYTLGLEREVLEENRKTQPLWNLLNAGTGQAGATTQMIAQSGASMADIISRGGATQAQIIAQGGANQANIVAQGYQNIGNQLMGAAGAYMNYASNRDLNTTLSGILSRLGTNQTGRTS